MRKAAANKLASSNYKHYSRFMKGRALDGRVLPSTTVEQKSSNSLMPSADTVETLRSI